MNVFISNVFYQDCRYVLCLHMHNVNISTVEYNLNGSKSCVLQALCVAQVVSSSCPTPHILSETEHTLEELLKGSSSE